mgnify:CR=1 FL=1
MKNNITLKLSPKGREHLYSILDSSEFRLNLSNLLHKWSKDIISPEYKDMAFMEDAKERYRTKRTEYHYFYERNQLSVLSFINHYKEIIDKKSKLPSSPRHVVALFVEQAIVLTLKKDTSNGSKKESGNEGSHKE